MRSKNMRLQGKIALITGSSRGIGKHIALAMAEEGAKVVITFYDKQEGEKEKAIESARETGSDLIIPFDQRSRESVRSMMKQVNDKYGRIDILVNNAGINKPGDFDKITDDDWDLVVDTNMKGVFICCQEALPYLRENARVINISSISGQIGGPRTPSYAASKAGIMALTHNLARFVGHRGITVNCVAPGMIESEMLHATMPKSLQVIEAEKLLVRRKGQMEEVGDLVAYLATGKAGFITGQTININGGMWP